MHRLLLSFCCFCRRLGFPASRRPGQGPHQRLMHYVDEGGREQPVRTRDDWQRRRTQILAGMQEVMGPLPAEMRRGGRECAAPAPLDVQVLDSTEQQGVPRQTVSLASRNGERVTAYVWTPKGIAAGERRVAIWLCNPPETSAKRSSPATGRRTAATGLELAQRGYV